MLNHHMVVYAVSVQVSSACYNGANFEAPKYVCSYGLGAGLRGPLFRGESFVVSH